MKFVCVCVCVCVFTQTIITDNLSLLSHLVPDIYKEVLRKDEITTLASNLSQKHCKILGLLVDVSDVSDTATRNTQNLTALFRTDVMIEDWLLLQRCNNFNIRLMLRRAALVAGLAGEAVGRFYLS